MTFSSVKSSSDGFDSSVPPGLVGAVCSSDTPEAPSLSSVADASIVSTASTILHVPD